MQMSTAFQLTRLMRGVTSYGIKNYRNITFQLTRLMRGVTQCCCFHHRVHHISTHTPHARRDIPSAANQTDEHEISTHTPHARRDPEYADNIAALTDFNSHASCEA